MYIYTFFLNASLLTLLALNIEKYFYVHSSFTISHPINFTVIDDFQMLQAKTIEFLFCFVSISKMVLCPFMAASHERIWHGWHAPAVGFLSFSRNGHFPIFITLLKLLWLNIIFFPLAMSFLDTHILHTYVIYIYVYIYICMDNIIVKHILVCSNFMENLGRIIFILYFPINLIILIGAICRWKCKYSSQWSESKYQLYYFLVLVCLVFTQKARPLIFILSRV